MDLDAPTSRYSYAKHYTPPKYSLGISKFIRDHIDRMPSRLMVMDPACGNMDLLRAFNMLFGERSLRFMGIDLYPEKNLPYSVVQGNAFQLSQKYFGRMDAIITNPPFGRKGHPSLDSKTQVDMDDHFYSLMEEIGLDNGGRIQVTLELAFLGLVTNVLKESGFCAIVLPESIFTCASYKDFRVKFESRFSVLGILQLPVNAFSGSNATASTAVLLFKNKPSKQKAYTYTVQDENGEKVKITSGFGSWFPFKDIDFMSPPPGQENLPWKSLGELYPHIKIKSGFKGKQPPVTSTPTSKNSGKYITSKFISGGKILLDDAPYVLIDRQLERTIAQPGDILLVRSGSGCLGKAAIVGNSKIPIIPRSEIYVLTGFKSIEERNIIFQSIQLATIDSNLPWWSKILGRGVGTPNLNKEEILKIPILDSTIEQIAKFSERLKKSRRAA